MVFGKKTAFQPGDFNLRLVTIERNGYAEPAVLLGDEAIGIQGAGFKDVRQVIAGGADALDRVTRWLDSPPGSERFEAATVKLLAPIHDPPKIICIGLNYRDHAAESNLAVPETPTVFCEVSDFGHRAGRAHRAAESLDEAGLRSGIRGCDWQRRTGTFPRTNGKSTCLATRL